MSWKIKPSRSTPNQNGRILVVDDQVADGKMPYLLANELGYEALIVFDGHAAWSMVREKTFDLIVLDWNMPIVNGAEFLNRLENWPQTRRNRRAHHDVVIYSGDPIDRNDFRDAERFRIVDVWQKPFGPAKMLNRMTRALEATK